VTAPLRLDRSALGLGLRPPFLAALSEPDAPARYGLDCVEIISENFIGDAAGPRARLDAVARVFPVLGHSVSLDLVGPDPLDAAALAHMRALYARLAVPFATDHLAWSRSDGRSHHDLLPVPCASALVPYAAARIRAVESALGVPFGIENPSTYLQWEADDLPEWDFLVAIAEAADCGILLDLNNVHVASRNHGFDPADYLAAIPWERVLCVHLAGHTERPDGLLHDTHDAPVSEAVWALYAEAWRLGGPFPTILERDARIRPSRRSRTSSPTPGGSASERGPRLLAGPRAGLRRLAGHPAFAHPARLRSAAPARSSGAGPPCARRRRTGCEARRWRRWSGCRQARRRLRCRPPRPLPCPGLGPPLRRHPGRISARVLRIG